MKFSKLLSASTLTLALFSTSVVPVFANESSKTVETSSITTMDQLDERFNLQTITEIPEGVIPLEFDSIEEAAKYFLELENGDVTSDLEINNTTQTLEITPFYNTPITTTKVGRFNATSAATLSATISYVAMGNGMIDLVSVKSQAQGNGSWTWSQSSYTIKKLDGGRSIGINISGVLTNIVYVGGVLKQYKYSETVYVEI
ncbi:hypothetical protein I6G82_02395 [Lysinibacillus macroides]|uniref:DUF5626 domain-containing protein n=1 Tax=Lysinibacillus macroides TaxID=33935 RepID=A0A0M9DH31_9BACI|nr:hypothetical protein [Lysinibacillus macroides]KOY81328.1 hypothetical protein ADM90_19570 [Lysinibacillus macroides]QPR68504.1 hypothetical protein I6G82_02395 [Lysinibacillus macroides]